MKNIRYFLLILSLIAFSFASCDKEGCIDANACNFDASAKKNNGTCNYDCNLTNNSNCPEGELRFYEIWDSLNLNSIDNEPGSLYQGQIFAELTLTINKYEICKNGNYTPLLGHGESLIAFKNVTNKTITFDYLINQSDSGGFTKKYYGHVSNLAAGDTYELNTGYNTFLGLHSYLTQIEASNITYI